MNAKFEKWARSEKMELQEGYYNDFNNFETQSAWEAWQAAIQSLEVTPDLVRVAEKARCNSLGVAVDPQPSIMFVRNEAMTAALTAFLSALKEQAK